MLTRSLVAFLLAIPATVALVGVWLAITPESPSKILPMLLLFYPAYIGIACASYLFLEAKTAAAVLVAVASVGFGFIALLKFLGMAGL